MYNFWTTWKFHLQVNNVISGSFNCLVLSAALTGSFYVAYYRSLSMQQKEQLARAKALADEARLLMLRYQINPHFLFNALNAIQSMIEKDKVRAKEMIADLSDFFRYTLSKNNQMLVPLGDEIEAVRKYLAIQKDRFAGRLEIDYEIEGDALKVMLPFFIIHPLVENAVKYGFSSETDILRLFIGVTRNGQTLGILVKNTGRLVPAERRAGGESTGTRTGIDNIKKRLALFYPDCSAFELLEKDRCVHALITITHPSMSA
jgi:LytS/YehU family sensor histidine kinase